MPFQISSHSGQTGKRSGSRLGTQTLPQRANHRGSHHHGLGQFVPGHVVGKALVVALFGPKIGTLQGALVHDGLGTGAQFLAHGASLDTTGPAGHGPATLLTSTRLEVMD